MRSCIGDIYTIYLGITENDVITAIYEYKYSVDILPAAETVVAQVIPALKPSKLEIISWTLGLRKVRPAITARDTALDWRPCKAYICTYMPHCDEHNGR